MVQKTSRTSSVQKNIPVRLGFLTRGKQLIHDFCSQVWVVKLCRYLSPFSYQRENAEKILRLRDMVFGPLADVSIVGGDTVKSLLTQMKIAAPVINVKPKFQITLNEKEIFVEQKIRITVTNEDSMEAAFRLKKENAENIAILNMANRWQLGGVSGNPFCRGSQEEALFRSSNLRNSLSSEEFHKKFKEMRTQDGFTQKGLRTVMHHIPYFGTVVSKDVTFIQTKVEEKQHFSVISAAAPDMRPGSDEYATLQGKKWESVMVYKIRAIFEAAFSINVKRLVLGAFGCGCFANDPERVAILFKQILKEERYKDQFSEVVFAIKGSGDNPAYRAFEEVFPTTDHGGAEHLD